MAILKSREIAFHYSIIGVKEEEELLFLVADLGLLEDVSFIPTLSQDEVYKKMIDSDLLLLPSIEEGIANVCIEAMFCKLLVLSTNCGGMEELIEDGKTGFLVPTRSPIDIAIKIGKILSLSGDEISLITDAARLKVEKQHNEVKMIADMESLYIKVYATN